MAAAELALSRRSAVQVVLGGKRAATQEGYLCYARAFVAYTSRSPEQATKRTRAGELKHRNFDFVGVFRALWSANIHLNQA